MSFIAVESLSCVTAIVCPSVQFSCQAFGKGYIMSGDVNPGHRQRIRINVGGKLFLTTPGTLSKLPGTRLAELKQSDPSYDEEYSEYYFDRNHILFGAILDLYRYGEFHFPHCMCGPFVRRELEFWKIPEEYIALCCQRSYGQFEEEQKQIARMKRVFHETEGRTRLPTFLKDRSDCWAKLQRWRWSLWRFLEVPDSSLAAKIWGVVFLLIVMGSVAILCMITDPSFRDPLDIPLRNITAVTNPKIRMYLSTAPNIILLTADNVCFGVFAVELLLRFILCPYKLNFFKSFYNIVDIFCVIPMGIMIIFEYAFPEFWGDDTLFQVYSTISILSIFRAVRLLKFARQFTGIKILLLAIRASIRELILLLLLMFMGVLVFSCMIYFAEFYQDDNFHNIPIGFWWSIVTMTTVGYGDKHPKSGWGYLVGALCALCGMLATGLPIPIIANNFNFYYNYCKAQECLERRRRQIERKKRENSISIMPSVSSQISSLEINMSTNTKMISTNGPKLHPNRKTDAEIESILYDNRSLTQNNSNIT